jgi:hypothetical protein
MVCVKLFLHIDVMNLAATMLAICVIDGILDHVVQLVDEVIQLATQVPRQVDNAVYPPVGRRLVGGPPVVEGRLVAVGRVVVEEANVARHEEVEVL